MAHSQYRAYWARSRASQRGPRVHNRRKNRVGGAPPSGDSQPMTGDYQSNYQRIEQAIRYLDDHAREQPSLAGLAGHLGLSPHHCHRLFHRWAGITPKDFLQVATLEYAKGLLAASRPVLETALDAGLSGPSRLHDLFLGIDAMTPGEYRRGIEIRWERSWGHISTFNMPALASRGESIFHKSLTPARTPFTSSPVPSPLCSLRFLLLNLNSDAGRRPGGETPGVTSQK